MKVVFCIKHFDLFEWLLMLLKFAVLLWLYRCRATPLPHLEVKEIKHVGSISEKVPFSKAGRQGTEDDA